VVWVVSMGLVTLDEWDEDGGETKTYCALVADLVPVLCSRPVSPH
jgi:hypothetical protein